MSGSDKNLFRRLREAQMWTKTELARKAGVSVLTVDRVERGFPCRLSTQRKILLAFGFSLTEVRRLLDEELARQEAEARALESLAVREEELVEGRRPFEGLSVMVVDDEQGVRDLLRGRLEHWGCQVRVASEGDEALMMYRASPPDVVLMDMEMPGKGGLAAIEEILGVDPQASILLMTGAWDTGPARRALERKMVKLVLAKPFHMEQLEMALQEVAPKTRQAVVEPSKTGAVA
jgi:CheY-like chemotaxis protein/DNA-binding XRE family transcriptional regulator